MYVFIIRLQILDFPFSEETSCWLEMLWLFFGGAKTFSSPQCPVSPWNLSSSACLMCVRGPCIADNNDCRVNLISHICQLPRLRMFETLHPFSFTFLRPDSKLITVSGVDRRGRVLRSSRAAEGRGGGAANEFKWFVVSFCARKLFNY